MLRGEREVVPGRYRELGRGLRPAQQTRRLLACHQAERLDQEGDWDLRTPGGEEQRFEDHQAAMLACRKTKETSVLKGWRGVVLSEGHMRATPTQTLQALYLVISSPLYIFFLSLTIRPRPLPSLLFPRR